MRRTDILPILETVSDAVYGAVFGGMLDAVPEEKGGAVDAWVYSVVYGEVGGRTHEPVHDGVREWL
jgi:hypothetical protein